MNFNLHDGSQNPPEASPDGSDPNIGGHGMFDTGADADNHVADPGLTHPNEGHGIHQIFQSDSNGHLTGHDVVDSNGDVIGYDIDGHSRYSLEHLPGTDKRFIYDAQHHKIGEFYIDQDGHQHIVDQNGHDLEFRPHAGDKHTFDLFNSDNQYMGNINEGPTGIEHFEGDPISEMKHIKFDRFEG